MNRKEFLTRSLQMCIGCGAVATLSPLVSSAGEQTGEQDAAQQEATFFAEHWREQWITDLMKTIDGQLDETERIALMQANGRACATRTSRPSMEQFTGDLDGLLDNFRDKLVGEVVQRDGKVSVSWDRCYCPIVKNGPAVISDTYCYCTTGWFHEIFEMVVGKPVSVSMDESIKRGDPRCKVTVTL